MNKINFIKQVLSLSAVAIFLLSACKRDRTFPTDPKPYATVGAYVLCEGAFSATTNSSSSSITYYDLTTSTSNKDYFKTQNGTDLGANANDLKQYGSKMYCVITGTTVAAKDSYLEVINIANGKSLKRIPFFDATKGFMPRFVVFYKDKAYISGYDGYVSKVDTSNLTIESRLAVGGALEGLTIVNNKLYVANSSHLYYPNANNSSVSVVDLNTFTKVKDIPVSFNPIKVVATENGDLFTVTKGNYADISASLDKLSSINDTKTQSISVNLFALNFNGNTGYAIVDNGWPNPNTLKTMNASTGAIGSNFVADGTVISSYYAVTVNTLNNDVFVADANNYALEGKVFCFGADGKKKFEFASGSLPQSVVFKYLYK